MALNKKETCFEGKSRIKQSIAIKTKVFQAKLERRNA